MTTGVDIPVRIIEGNDALVMLARIVNALEGTGNAAKTAEPKARSLGDALSTVGNAARHLNEVREAAVSLAEGILGAAERVAELAAEQQRLDANSARLGLNFSQAADRAGGFVSEMQTMQLATSLANRNIRVTQQELDALARIGMARAVDAGKNVEEVFDSIADSVVEGGEELEKFGSSLHSVADDSHTASDRLSALVQRGREMAPAMRTAADEVARFRNEVARAGRTISTGFVDEFARLSQLGRPFRDAATDAEDFNREMRAIGQTAAWIVAQVGNAVAIALGSIATVGSFLGERAGLVDRQRTNDLVAFLRGRYESFGAIAADTGDRRAAPPERLPPPRPDMVVTAEEEGIDPRTGRRTRQAIGGGGAPAPRRATMEELMGRAISGSRPEARLGDIAPTAAQRAALERAAELARKDAETRTEARERAYERSDEGIAARARKDLDTRREERELDRRYQAQLGFTDRLEDLSHRRINVAQEEAEAVSGAFTSMGKAFSDHLTAFIEGREELGAALQGMLADTLKAISQEAAVKAGLNLAEGFAALATYRYDAAAEHFAAAGIYTGVAALAGVGAAAVAPASGKPSGAPSASQDRSATPMTSGSQSSRGDTVINVAFNGPQYGTGGVVQAARELVGVINQGAVQGGVQINRIALGAGLRA